MRKQFVLVSGQLKEGSDGPLRIDVYTSPTPDEVRELVTVFDIDEHDVASALDAEEISRLDVDGDRIFAVWKRPKAISLAQSATFDVSSIGILLQRDRMVIIQPDDAPLFEDRRMRPYRSIDRRRSFFWPLRRFVSSRRCFEAAVGRVFLRRLGR